MFKSRIAAIAVAISAIASVPASADTLKDAIAKDMPSLMEIYKDLHQNPELSFQEFRTAKKLADEARRLGFTVTEKVGKTGVVAVLTNGSGPTVMLRADMDGLPVDEQTGLSYSSKTRGTSKAGVETGIMHACGHDGHTAMLLGATKYLSETRNFDGTVVVIFQPAEEGGGGGREMCEDGMMERWGIQEVYGMHNWPGQPVGSFAIRPGAFFAATDQFDITLTGRGGHAAKPQETIDTTVMASQVVMTLQTIASRNADPVDQVVVSVTSFETSSNAFNVIPQEVHLKGTVRTMSAAMRDLAEQRIKDICNGVAATFGGSADVTYDRGYPVMVNHDEQTAFAADVARKVSGACDDAPLVMGGEDFAFMLEERPGAYILVGNGDTAPVHHPDYNFSDEAIPAGCSWWAEIVEQRMPAA